MSCKDSSRYEDAHFLQELKRIALISLPKLVSIASGLHIGLKLENIIICECPNLKSPPTKDKAPNDSFFQETEEDEVMSESSKEVLGDRKF